MEYTSEKTYKKVEIDGKTFIEETVKETYISLIPIEDIRERKTNAQELIDLKI